jgi:hypothetical protein
VIQSNYFSGKDEWIDKKLEIHRMKWSYQGFRQGLLACAISDILYNIIYLSIFTCDNYATWIINMRHPSVIKMLYEYINQETQINWALYCERYILNMSIHCTTNTTTIRKVVENMLWSNKNALSYLEKRVKRSINQFRKWVLLSLQKTMVYIAIYSLINK